MILDWQAFTPWQALLGGVLIGLAAAWLALLHGRVAGISGMVSGLLERRTDWRARLAFVLGLMAAPGLWRLAVGGLPVSLVEAGGGRLLLAGILWASARVWRPVAPAAMAFAAWRGCRRVRWRRRWPSCAPASSRWPCLGIGGVKMATEWKRLLSMAGAGLLFGLGLLLSGMANPAKVLAGPGRRLGPQPGAGDGRRDRRGLAGLPSGRAPPARVSGRAGAVAGKTPLTRRLIGGDRCSASAGAWPASPGPALLLGHAVAPRRLVPVGDGGRHGAGRALGTARVKRCLPAWLSGYRREYLAGDLSAGLVVTLLLAPQGLAYALAGLPAEAGLYASIAPC